MRNISCLLHSHLEMTLPASADVGPTQSALTSPEDEGTVDVGTITMGVSNIIERENKTLFDGVCGKLLSFWPNQWVLVPRDNHCTQTRPSSERGNHCTQTRPSSARGNHCTQQLGHLSTPRLCLNFQPIALQRCLKGIQNNQNLSTIRMSTFVDKNAVELLERRKDIIQPRACSIFGTL